jgi:hypothetical protein
MKSASWNWRQAWLRNPTDSGESKKLAELGAPSRWLRSTLVEVVESLLCAWTQLCCGTSPKSRLAIPSWADTPRICPKRAPSKTESVPLDLILQHDAGRRRRARQELMHPYSSAEWESLFLAEAGASAALAGLLFVALSINLERILKGAGLPGRAGEAIVLLLTALVLSTWVLVPGQSAQYSAPSYWDLGCSRGWSSSRFTGGVDRHTTGTRALVDGSFRQRLPLD